MIKKILTIVSLYLIVGVNCKVFQSPPEPIVEDSKRTPCQLIESHNFICDQHWIMTDDGYILTAHHIINPILVSANLSTIKPVILYHGLFGSSNHFLINVEGGFASDWTNESKITVDLATEGRNLPYLLSNLRYDVWLINARGNKYSRNHTSLNPDSDSEFWKFSYEQMIAYDAPATIDYVLRQTGHETVAWIGHSQGNLILFGLLAERPEYSVKIKPFIALAPVTTVGHIKSPVRFIADIPLLQSAMTLIGGELSLPKSLINLFANKVCDLTGIKDICSSIFYLFGGYDPQQFNTTRLPVYIAHGFEGTSWWNLVHFGQNIRKNQFSKFDFGLIGNFRRYGSWKPPRYDLGAIDSKNIILISSSGDPLADTTDLETMRKALKVPVTTFIVENQKFSHLDFIWGIDVYTEVYEKLIKLLDKFR